MKKTKLSNEIDPQSNDVTNQVEEHQIKELPVNTRLALERTRGAYERTMMAWIRTGTSLIAFGFTVYKFFQLEISGIDTKTALIKTLLIGPREFGLILISIGILALLLGMYEHRRDIKALQKEYPGMPWSATSLIAYLMASLGGLALIAVIYRF
jgi:putative membrane protein